MAFESQSKKSKISSRRGSKAAIVVSQNIKASTNTDELSLRMSSEAISNMGSKIGEQVDVLYDQEQNLWMIKKTDSGFTISGKPDAPTGLIRYTLKEGHARLTNKKEDLPIKLDCDESSLLFSDDSVVFSLTK